MILSLKECLIKKITEIENIEKEIKNIREEISKLEERTDSLVKERDSKKGIFKIFYREKIKNLNSDINSARIETSEKNGAVSERMDKIREIEVSNKLYSIPGDTLEDKKTKILEAKFLDSLDISFEEAREILQNNGYEFILDESDKNTMQKEIEHGGSKGIALVRLTDSMPKDNTIYRRVDENSMHTIKGEFGEIQIPSSRETTHFCACSEVADVDFSEWDDKKIAIIIPLIDMSKDLDIKSYAPEDIQIKGKVTIPNSGWIICPKSHVELAKKNNPGCNIMPYEGENVRGLANALLSYLGYDFIRDNERHYLRREYAEWYDECIKKHFGLSEIKKGEHCDSNEYQEESVGQMVSLFRAFREAIKNGKIIYNDETKDEIKRIIFSQSGSNADWNLYEKAGLFEDLNLTEKDIEAIKDSRHSDLVEMLKSKISEALDMTAIGEVQEEQQSSKKEAIDEANSPTENLKKSYEEGGIEPVDLQKVRENIQGTVSQDINPNQSIIEGEEKDEY